jgi:hypothetical protein
VAMGPLKLALALAGGGGEGGGLDSASLRQFHHLLARFVLERL